MKASDWISVEDRLPNLGEYVFVAIEMKYDFEEKLEIVVDIGWLNEEGDFDTINDWNEGQQHFQVTHWQPIVFPKKEKL
jgi:hypothetical protein